MDEKLEEETELGWTVTSPCLQGNFPDLLADKTKLHQEDPVGLRQGRFPSMLQSRRCRGSEEKGGVSPVWHLRLRFHVLYHAVARNAKGLQVACAAHPKHIGFSCLELVPPRMSFVVLNLCLAFFPRTTFRSTFAFPKPLLSGLCNIECARVILFLIFFPSKSVPANLLAIR